MVHDRSVHSRLLAHAVYPPPPNRRRCLVCVRNQILWIMEMHVIGLLSPWEIPFAERSASILACVFSTFAVRFRSWLPTVYLVVCLAFLVFVGLALRLVILSFFLCLRLLFFLFSLSFLSFIDVLLLVLHLVLCSLSSFLSWRSSRLSSCFSRPSLQVFGWSVSVFVVWGRICHCVGRLVEFPVDVSYFQLHPFVCQLVS